MSLTGIWTNELRSVMLLRENADHSLDGIYHSIVGRDPGYRALSGRTNDVESGKQMVAFSVCFEIDKPSPGYGKYSVCAWSGWAEENAKKQLEIDTHWLLSISVLDRAAEWAATNIGEDQFLRILDSFDQATFEDEGKVRDLYKKASAA